MIDGGPLQLGLLVKQISRVLAGELINYPRPHDIFHPLHTGECQGALGCQKVDVVLHDVFILMQASEGLNNILAPARIAEIPPILQLHELSEGRRS